MPAPACQVLSPIRHRCRQSELSFPRFILLSKISLTLTSCFRWRLLGASASASTSLNWPRGAGEPSIQSLHILWRRGKGRLVPQQNKNLYIFPECSRKQRNWGNEEVGPVGAQVVQQEALYRQWPPHETPKEQGGGWLQNCASPGLLCSMWKWTFCPDERKISVNCDICPLCSFWFW